ncbi:aminotransferase class I/II-fold pyridoxal phosphate-dependent enzyme [Hydrotalea sp.]|uniref:aminotransferase class I/II-fold pyridoxal phosphate-dependent enzyme n=1 Tax=Hydrotalea sp. TaxID=2881279 RepID=UPI003D0C069D
MYNDHFLDKKIEERTALGLLRKLKLPDMNAVDFFSNDYLGIVKNHLIHQETSQYFAFGATGSRLLSGNYALMEQVEKIIAGFHETESALLFNSGYDANVGVLSSIPQKGDTILYDALSHASIREGVRLSFAKSFSFKHNDMQQLEDKLKTAKGNVFIVTESVFSMDGDVCPLQDLIHLSQKYGAHLIIDEAHATGIIGNKGEGLTQHLQVQNSVFARIHTFGKALGCQGAVVVGSNRLKKYLINFSRPLIYTTALPPILVQGIMKSYQLFPTMESARSLLRQHIQQFQQAKIPFQKLNSQTPIQGVVIPGYEQVITVAQHLQKNGMAVRPILYPTVPKGAERLRIVLHAFNTKEEIQKLLQLLNNMKAS